VAHITVQSVGDSIEQKLQTSVHLFGFRAEIKYNI